MSNNIEKSAFPGDDFFDDDKQVGWPNRGLSKREYAAIHLRVPDSGDPQIDAMITKALKRDLAMDMAKANITGAIKGKEVEYADMAFTVAQHIINKTK